MITIDAARAIGREADLGSLEVGKLADITTIKMTSPHLMPRLMPIHQLMLYGNAGDVADVFVAGRALMRERKVLTVSEADVFEWRTSSSVRRLRAWRPSAARAMSGFSSPPTTSGRALRAIFPRCANPESSGQ